MSSVVDGNKIKSIEGSFSPSPQSKKWELSENERLLQKANKSIKRSLLNQTGKSIDIPLSPSQSVMMTAVRGSQNYFFFDEASLDKTKHIDTQRDRRFMQEQLQMLYNRVLLLEKEDKKAVSAISEMQRTTSKMLQAKRMHSERLNLNEMARNFKESDKQMKLVSNCFCKNRLRLSVANSVSNSFQKTLKKADTMKIIQKQTKQDLNANNEFIQLQNQQSFNFTRAEEKNHKYNRQASIEMKKKKALDEHQQRCINEERIRQEKEKEYQILEEKEKYLLAKLQNSQNLFDQSVADMRKVITLPLATNQSNSSQQIQEIKKNILKNQSSINSNNISSIISPQDIFFNKHVNPHVRMTTYSFPAPIPPSPRSHTSNNLQASLSQYNNNNNHVINKVLTSSTVIYAPSELNGVTTTREDHLMNQEEKRQNNIMNNFILHDEEGENEARLKTPSNSASSRKVRTSINFNRYQKQPSNEIENKSQQTNSQQKVKLPLNFSPPHFPQRQTMSTKASTLQSLRTTPNAAQQNFSMVCPPSNFQSASHFSAQKVYRV